MKRKSFIIEYIISAGVVAIAAALFAMWLMYDFERGKGPELRENIGLIGLLAFIFLYVVAVMPLALMQGWNWLAELMWRVPMFVCGKSRDEPNGSPRTHRLAWILTALANYVFSVFLTAVLAATWCFHATDASVWFDPAVVQCFNIGLGFAVAPAAIMGIRRILLLMLPPLGRIFSDVTEGIKEVGRRRRDAMLEALDRLLGIRPKP